MLFLELTIEAERPLGGTAYTHASDSGEGETAIPRARDPGTENGRFSIPASGLPGLEADFSWGWNF